MMTFFIGILLLFLLLSFVRRKLQYFFTSKHENNEYYISKDGEEKIIVDVKVKEEDFLNDYINKINNIIITEDSELHEAVDRLLSVLSNMDKYLLKHTEKSNDIKELADFYLPDIISNLLTYKEVANTDFGSDSKNKMRSSLLETLNMISNAFSTILNEFYDNIALNVSASLDAIKSSIRMKGLSR